MIAEVAERLPAGPLTLAALIMVMVGVGFKISAVPFHLWAPDVYEGGPILVSVFLAVASKAAGFALFVKVIAVAFEHVGQNVGALVALLSVLTMTVANLITLHQKNIKRFLAWSSVAQAGYLLVGLAPGGYRADASVAYYLIVYLVTSLAAFGVAMIVAQSTRREDMREYVGLSESNPKLAFVMMLALFSLGGIPPRRVLGSTLRRRGEGGMANSCCRRGQLDRVALLLPDDDPLMYIEKPTAG
jgi:NADH-quinone oxidoreductase subunit N